MHDLLFIIYAAVAMVLLLLASPPHFRSANVGAICLVAWCFVGAFGFFVNAIVWWDNVEDHAPVWCDIWTRIHVGLATGIASGCLCINRRLYIISSARRTSVSSKDRRKGLILDLAIGLVPPFFVMAIYYTVQGNRYNLAEGFGCLPAPYINWHAILACYVPALTVGAASFCYGGLSIWNFTSRRLQFQSVLQTSGGGLNTSRFIRLVSLSTVEMLVSVPLGSWVISYIVDTSFMPVLSWNDTHADFSMVYIFNADSMLANPTSARGNSVQRWIPVFATFLYFSFFGVQEEALVSYWSALKKGWRLVQRLFGKKKRSDAPSHTDDTFLRVPQLGNTIGPVSPTNPCFPNRSAEDLEKGGLSLQITDDGEREASLGMGHKKSGIAVRVERNVVEE